MHGGNFCLSNQFKCSLKFPFLGILVPSIKSIEKFLVNSLFQSGFI